MSTSLILLAIYGLIHFINFILRTDMFDDKKEYSLPQPKINLDKRPILKCYHILNLDPDATYTLDDVNKAYYKRLQEMSASREKGIEPTYELKEYQSAKQVMNDFYAYAAFRN